MLKPNTRVHVLSFELAQRLILNIQRLTFCDVPFFFPTLGLKLCKGVFFLHSPYSHLSAAADGLLQKRTAVQAKRYTGTPWRR